MLGPGLHTVCRHAAALSVGAIRQRRRFLAQDEPPRWRADTQRALALGHSLPGAGLRSQPEIDALDSVAQEVGKAVPQVARNWLLSANPRLDGLTPAQLVREDRIPEVFRAAEAFVADSYYS